MLQEITKSRNTSILDDDGFINMILDKHCTYLVSMGISISSSIKLLSLLKSNTDILLYVIGVYYDIVFMNNTNLIPNDILRNISKDVYFKIDSNDSMCIRIHYNSKSLNKNKCISLEIIDSINNIHFTIHPCLLNEMYYKYCKGYIQNITKGFKYLNQTLADIFLSDREIEYRDKYNMDDIFEYIITSEIQEPALTFALYFSCILLHLEYDTFQGDFLKYL